MHYFCYSNFVTIVLAYMNIASNSLTCMCHGLAIVIPMYVTWPGKINHVSTQNLPYLLTPMYHNF